MNSRNKILSWTNSRKGIPAIAIILAVILSVSVSGIKHCECTCHGNITHADGANEERCYRQCGIACGSLTDKSVDCEKSCDSNTGYCKEPEVDGDMGDKVRDGCRVSCKNTCEVLAMEGTATETLRTIALVVAAVVLAICGLTSLLSTDPSSRDMGKKCVMYVILALIIVGLSLSLVRIFTRSEAELPAFGAVIFYKDENFAGEQLMYTKPGEVSDLGPTGMEDKISSIKIERGFYVIVYEHKKLNKDKRGDMREIERSFPILKEIGWNNRISSVEIIAGEATKGVHVYEDKNFGANELIFTGLGKFDDLDDPHGRNQHGLEKEISSIKLDDDFLGGNYYVVIHKKDGCTGTGDDKKEVTGDVPELGKDEWSGWNDKIRCIEIVRG